MSYKLIIFIFLLTVVPLFSHADTDYSKASDTTGVNCTQGSTETNLKGGASEKPVSIDCDCLKASVVGACGCINNQLTRWDDKTCQDTVQKAGSIYLSKSGCGSN